MLDACTYPLKITRKHFTLRHVWVLTGLTSGFALPVNYVTFLLPMSLSEGLSEA